MYYLKQNNDNNSIKPIYRCSICFGILLLCVAWPLSSVLPVSISFENGFLENLQVIILMLGAFYNIFLIHHSSDKQIGDFHIWCAVFEFFMAFRELSWGRVFYPIEMEDSGPAFVAMSDFTWHDEVHVIIVATIIFLLLFALKYLPLKKMLHCSFPILIFVVMIVAVIFSYIGDHGMIVGKLQGQIVEEFGELAFYCLIPALCIHYHRQLSEIKNT